MELLEKYLRESNFQKIIEYLDKNTNVQNEITSNQYRVHALIGLNQLNDALTLQLKIVNSKDNAKTWGILGDVYEKLKKYDDAISAYDRAIEKKPHEKKFWVEESKIYEKINKLDDALFCIDKAISFDINNIDDLNLKLEFLKKLNLPNEILATESKIKKITKKLSMENSLTVANKMLKKFPNQEKYLRAKLFSLNALNRFEEALPIIDKLLEENPNDTKLVLRKVFSLNALNRFEEALPIIDKLLEENPNNTKLLQQKAFYLNSLNRFEEALPIIDKLLEENPNNPKILYQKIRALNSFTLSEEALPIIDKLLEENPNNTKLLQQKAFHLNYLNRFEEALPIIDKLLEENPNDTKLLRQKVFSLNSLDHFEEALPIIDKLLEENPNNTKLLQQKAFHLNSLNRFEEALLILEDLFEKEPNFTIVDRFIKTKELSGTPVLSSYFDLKLSQNPNNIVFQYGKLKSIISEKKFTEAIKFFNSQKTFHFHEKFLISVGYCYEKLKNFTEATNIYEKLISTDTVDVAALIGKANICVMQEKFSEGYLNFEIAYQKNPLPNLIPPMIYCLKQDGKYFDAIDLIEKSLTPNPNNAKLLILKADLLYHVGKVDESLQLYVDLKNKDPKNISCLMGISKLYQNMNRSELSLKITDQILDIDSKNIGALKLKIFSLTKLNKFKEAKYYIDLIEQLSDESNEFDGTVRFENIEDQINELINKKILEKLNPNSPSDQFSIFPNQNFETEQKIEELFSNLQEYIWIQDSYLDSKTFDYLKFSMMHDDSNIREIKLMSRIAWNTIDKITVLLKKRKNFNKQFKTKNCELFIGISNEFGKDYHDRFIFDSHAEWVWAGAEQTHQSKRIVVSKILNKSDELKDREDFSRLWSESVEISNKQKILEIFKENSTLWNEWKTRHDYTEEEAIEMYTQILTGEI